MSKVSALVVDDAPFIRDLMKKGLRDNFPGLHIEEAVNGRKAQQLLSRQNVDLILCDWEMPEMSGLELLTWCRAQENLKTTPFIMVTSRGDKENVVQAIQAGVSDYIGKPFSNDPAGSGNPLGQAQLRLPQSSMPCVIKAVSLKEAQLVVKRADPLPQVLESAVLDLEENSDVARLNGYLHAIAALEPKPDSDWLLLTLRFVDRDPQKLDYLSRLIARGSTQKHYVPGA